MEYVQNIIDCLNSIFLNLSTSNVVKLFSPFYYSHDSITHEKTLVCFIDILLQHLPHTSCDDTVVAPSFHIAACKREVREFIDVSFIHVVKGSL